MVPVGEGTFIYVDEVPVPLKRVQPKYPKAARKAHIEGKVTLNVLVDRNGLVKEVRVVHGVPELNAAAIEAIGRWTFRPAKAKGEPIAVWVEQSIDFHF